MKRELKITNDGSATIYIPEMDETYHSTHGAIQEAKHVFIENGLRTFEKNGESKLNILEVGFGTGLNALLTLINLGDRVVEYTGIEAYPVEMELVQGLNYVSELGEENQSNFDKLHTSGWNDLVQMSDQFSLKKVDQKIQEIIFVDEYFDLVYFDAFGPRAQGEMWKKEVLEKVAASMKTGGILVTYCAMGQFKRDLKSLGFEIEALPGPPGKREMTRATKG